MRVMHWVVGFELKWNAGLAITWRWFSGKRENRRGPTEAATKRICWRGNCPLSPADAGWGCFDIPATPVSRLWVPYAARFRGQKAIRGSVLLNLFAGIMIVSVVDLKFAEEQKQILRLTTPELKNVRGPFRSE